jgi:opacity protein-like surface antigen
MFKKMILASSIVAITAGVTVANAAPYVGAGLGINTNTSNVRINGSNYVGGGSRAAMMNLFAGYGSLVNQSIYLAGELSLVPFSADISGNGKLSPNWTYGASFIPGVMLSDHTMLFGRVGVVSSGYHDQSTGAQFGGGLQTSLTQNVDLRGEYDFTSYKSYTQMGRTVSPRSDQFTASLVYKFE